MGGEERKHKIGKMLSVNADSFEAHIGGLVVGGMASAGPDGTRNLRNYIRAVFSPSVFVTMSDYAKSRLAMAMAQGSRSAVEAVRVTTQADFSRKRKIWSTEQDVQGRFGEQPIRYPPKRGKVEGTGREEGYGEEGVQAGTVDGRRGF